MRSKILGETHQFSQSVSPSVVVIFSIEASSHHHQRHPDVCSMAASIIWRTNTLPSSTPLQLPATTVGRTTVSLSLNTMVITMTVLMVLTMVVMTADAFSNHHIYSRTTLTYQRIDTTVLAASHSSSSSSSQPQRQRRKGPPRQGGYQNGNTHNRRPGNNNSNKRNNRRGPRDPRVAKSIATNRQILDCDFGTEVLSVLSSTPDALTKMAGGGALSVVNIATSIHRISRSASRDRRERQAILSDPRYALLLCSATEALKNGLL